MTPKHVDYNLLCAVPLDVHPKSWEELSQTDAFLYRVLAYPLIDETAFIPAYNVNSHRQGASPALLWSSAES